MQVVRDKRWFFHLNKIPQTLAAELHAAWKCAFEMPALCIETLGKRSVFLVDLHIDRKILFNATVYPGSAKAHSSVTHYGHNCCRWHAAFIMWPVGSASGFLYCCQSALWDMNALLSVSYNGTFNKWKNDFNIHLNFHKQTYIKNIHLKNVLWSSCNTDTDY